LDWLKQRCVTSRLPGWYFPANDNVATGLVHAGHYRRGPREFLDFMNDLIVKYPGIVSRRTCRAQTSLASYAD
jgi:hypothetical protein